MNKEFKDFIDIVYSLSETKIFDGKLPDGVDRISATPDENIMRVYIEFDEHTRADTEVDIENLGFIKSKREILQGVYEFLGIEEIENECESECECECESESNATTREYNEIEVKSNLYTKEDS